MGGNTPEGQGVAWRGQQVSHQKGPKRWGTGSWTSLLASLG